MESEHGEGDVTEAGRGVRRVRGRVQRPIHRSSRKSLAGVKGRGGQELHSTLSRALLSKERLWYSGTSPELACMLSGFTNGIGVRPRILPSLVNVPPSCVCLLNDKLRQRVLGYSSSTSTPTSIPSIVAEPETTSVAFPAVGSQQRAPCTDRQGTDAPSLSLSPPGADSDQSGDELPDQDEQDEDTFDLPSVRINGSGASASASSARKQPRAAAAAGLLPPPSTTKVVKAPKGRVRVEKGFSQLDWAKLNRSGEVDLRVSSFLPSLRG